MSVSSCKIRFRVEISSNINLKIQIELTYTGGILFNPDLAVEEVFHVLSSTF